MLSIKEIKTIPKAIHRRNMIILISHMRAYTSLTGHILGSHPEIEGYYEMHKGYFSWKSIYHAKLLYYANHEVKRTANYLFDKVLHNEHKITSNFLQRPDVIPIFSIRNPEDTLPSIINHYRKNDLSNKLCRIEHAANYYYNRLIELEKTSHKVKGKYIYFDAESLTENTQDLLKFISNRLDLKTELSPNYKRMEKTGSRFSGDNSGNILSGKVQINKKETRAIHEDSKLINQLNEKYHKTRALLEINSHVSYKTKT